MWTLITNATKTPKIKSVTARSGKIIMKPQDEESADVLRSIANNKKLIKEDTAKWPCVSIDQIDASLSPAEISEQLVTQNQDILSNANTTDIVPVLKRGSRTNPVTK